MQAAKAELTNFTAPSPPKGELKDIFHACGVDLNVTGDRSSAAFAALGTYTVLPVSLPGLSVEGSEKGAVPHWQSDEWHIYNF